MPDCDVLTPGKLAYDMVDAFSEASIEDLIDAVRVLVKRDREGYVKEELLRSGRIYETDPVLACFDGCDQSLREASLAIYASTK